jgi:hypothetical protein
MSSTDALLLNPEEMTWDQLEAERRSILTEMTEKYGSFEEAPLDLTKRFIEISHKARLMVKPAGKPAADASKRKPKSKGATLDELSLDLE